MDTQMKIDADTVRTLREEKSWSQEHLASASGLSVRTVQRVESDGIGSAETRLALAGALGVPVARLLPGDPAAVATWARHNPIAGWLGWGVGAVCSIGAVAYNYYAGHASAGEAGTALGVIFAFLGTTAGAMAAYSQRIKSRGSAA
jgi:drug/metabolite transporter (DMT)-like permease